MISISSKLSRVISRDAIDCVSGKLTLDSKDIKDLTQILSSNNEDSRHIDRKRAVKAFMQIDVGEKRSDVLGKILLDHEELPGTRLSAAYGLGKKTDSKNEKKLLSAVNTTSGHIQREVVKSLGRVGTTASLESLSSLPTTNNTALKQAVSFAKTLINIRENTLDTSSLSRSLQANWVHQGVQKLKPAQIKVALASLNENTFGIGLNDKIAYQFNCLNATNTLLLNNDIDLTKPSASFSEKTRISAIIALKNPREVNSTVRYLVMTEASENEDKEPKIDIIVTRTAGEIVYSGEAQVVDGMLHFSIRDVGETGTPTNIEGTVDENGIDFAVNNLVKRRVKSGQLI